MMTFYEDLLTNLNNNKILMQTASYNEALKIIILLMLQLQ